MTDSNDILKNAEAKINETIELVNISLSNSKPKIIICYAEHCQFCQEYMDSIDKEYQHKEGNMEVWYFDVGQLNFKIWAKSQGVKVLPCTLFMDKDNRIKGKIDGRIDTNKINIVAQQIFVNNC